MKKTLESIIGGCFVLAIAAIYYFYPTIIDQGLCLIGHSDSCIAVGNVYEEGERMIKKSYEKAAEYYEKACNAGNGDGCNNLALLYDDGKMGNSAEKAVKYFEKACELNSAYGCAGLGSMYYEGKGVGMSGQKGTEYMQKACDLGYKDACDVVKSVNRLADMFGVR